MFDLPTIRRDLEQLLAFVHAFERLTTLDAATHEATHRLGEARAEEQSLQATIARLRSDIDETDEHNARLAAERANLMRPRRIEEEAA
jgi:septal ring factor EnvC (AmiA/AmiB activator)